MPHKDPNVHREYKRLWMRAKRDRMKEEMIALHGGKCKLCGYNKCSRAMEFHHMDPLSKKLEISTAMSIGTRLAVVEELKGCILLCSNCHREVEAGVASI